MGKICSLFVFLSIHISVIAQHQIYGTIINSKGEPLTGVNVMLYAEKDTLQFINGTFSNNQGVWNFSNLQQNNYLLQFVLLGYEKQERKLNLSNKDVYLDTVKMEIASESLKEVVINAELFQIEGTKETRLFTMTEKERAISALDLMTNVPQLSFDKLNNKLATIARKPILILCDGKIIDEIDLLGLKPDEITKADYYAQPPARYKNMGIDAVLSVTTKRIKERGGYIMTNLKNGFTTGYGTNIVQGKYNSGDNDYSLRYFIDYRDLDKNRLSQAYETQLNRTQYQIDRQGENSDYIGQYHVIAGSFSNTKTDDHLLSAKFRLSVNPGMEDIRQKIYGVRNDFPIEEQQLNTYIHTNYISPKLDLYYSKQMKNNQELLFNVVNTYYDTKSDRIMSQTSSNDNSYEIATHINTKTYSIISEIDYTKGFDKYELDIGIRHFYKNSTENFNSDNDGLLNNQNTINNLYGYVELSRKLNKFSLVAGVGGEQSWLDISSNNTNSYFVFKPELSLTYALNGVSTFQFVSTVQSYVPDMSLLSESPVYLDSTIFISIGNSHLKPYYMLINSIFYIFNKQPFYFKTSLSHFYAHQPYYTVIVNKDAYLEKTYWNIDNMKTLKYDVLFNWKPNNWFTLNAYYSIEYQLFKVTENLYDHWFNMFNVSSSISYRNFTLNVQSIKQNKSLEGNLYRTVNNYYAGDVTWKKKQLSLTLGTIFSNSPEILEAYNDIPVYYKESRVWNNFKGLCYLQLSYTLDFGKNTQRSIKQQLNNEDKDIGINPDNISKQ